MPLLRAAMYAKGVQLYCAPTVDDRDQWLPTIHHIALEGRCFVLSCCQFVDGLIRGGSAIVDPLGNLVMRYDTREPPKGLLDDLKKLLKLSHIG